MESATVKVLNPMSTARERISAGVLCRDGAGATIRLEQPLLVGATIQIRFHDGIALGEIRSCSAADGQFDLAVLFQDVLPTGDKPQ